MREGLQRTIPYSNTVLHKAERLRLDQGEPPKASRLWHMRKENDSL